MASCEWTKFTSQFSKSFICKLPEKARKRVPSLRAHVFQLKTAWSVFIKCCMNINYWLGQILGTQPRLPSSSKLLYYFHSETDIPGSPVFSSSSPPSLPPRSKTYHTLSQSMVSSGNFGTGAVRKRNAVDPYANFDRLQRAKQIAEKAIKVSAVFCCNNALYQWFSQSMGRDPNNGRGG